MQDAKESLKNLVTQVTENYHKWAIQHLWPARILEYFLLVLLVAVVGAIFFKFFNLFQTDADSARYMLSALVQSQAAIIAIVISLTLIAVQLTASAYSPRVIRMFLRTPDMWILLVLYGFSISYGLLILKLIRTEDLQQIILFGYSLEHHIVTLYLYGGFTFIGLFLYTWSIINLLNPATIINRLTTDITKDTLLNLEEDPIQPIMDIVHGSLMKYDITTTRVGLKVVTDHVITLIEAESIDQKDEQKIIERFCTPVEFVGLLAVSNLDDEISAIEVIANFKNFGEASAEKELLSATWQVAGSLGVLGKAAAEKGFESATIEAVGSIGKVGLAAAKKRLSIASGEAARSLGEIGVAAAENKLKDATKQAVWSLVVVGKVAVEKELENEVEQAAESLADITMVSEEIVKNVIREYESALGEEDQTVFQKFVGLYRQELEKLRAEQKNSKADADSKSESK